jgi:dienelactone hydrolase
MANRFWAHRACGVILGWLALGAMGHCASAQDAHGTSATTEQNVAAKGRKSPQYGSFGPEGPRMREQFWVLPSGDPGRGLRATVFRPDENAGNEQNTPRPLVVINHGTSSATRLSVAMPVYYWLSKWFVDRGYVVVVPQRRGHGATGGELDEAVGTCADPDHARSGEIAADDIEAVIDYMTREPDIVPHATVVVGISTGGWASLALAARNPPQVRAVVNIAGGRGGHAGGQPRAICGKDRLVEAAGRFGSTSRVPTLWLYSKNDSYFGPTLASNMAEAWRAGGAEAELEILPPYGSDGHDIANDRAGWDVWGAIADRFLTAPDTRKLAVSASATPSSVSPIETGALQARR